MKTKCRIDSQKAALEKSFALLFSVLQEWVRSVKAVRVHRVPFEKGLSLQLGHWASDLQLGCCRKNSEMSCSCCSHLIFSSSFTFSVENELIGCIFGLT